MKMCHILYVYHTDNRLMSPGEFVFFGISISLKCVGKYNQENTSEILFVKSVSYKNVDI